MKSFHESYSTLDTGKFKFKEIYKHECLQLCISLVYYFLCYFIPKDINRDEKDCTQQQLSIPTYLLDNWYRKSEEVLNYTDLFFMYVRRLSEQNLMMEHLTVYESDKSMYLLHNLKNLKIMESIWKRGKHTLFYIC